LGCSQLRKADQFLTCRERIVEQYNKLFSEIPEIVTPYVKKDVRSSWHLYVIQLNLAALKVGRKEIFEALLRENIGVNVHYIPVYTLPYYRELGYKPGLCPNAERLYQRIISLPLFPKMTERDISDVYEAVRKVIYFYKN